MQKISVVILDYFKAERVKLSVLSLLKQKGDFELEIIIVDNSCSQKNAKILQSLANKKVKVLINKKNLGYSKAYNKAVEEKVTGEYLLILNPDIIFKKEDDLQKMFLYLKNNPEIGVLGPKQVNDENDKKEALTVRAFPNLLTQVSRRTFLRFLPYLKEKVAYDEAKNLDKSKIQEVDWLQSSCVIIKTDWFLSLGKFNEKYFLFMADTEICLKTWLKGKKVVFYPEVTVLADGLRCSRGGFLSFFTKKVLRIHFYDALKYYYYHWKDKK
jgi:GT2 family glycosyltransferase